MSRAEAKEQTREALLFAALELFAETGLDGPSLDAICARAGKTRGALYVHFADREALVVALVERVLTEYIEALVVAAAQADGLARSIEVFADLLVRATAGHAPDLGRFARLGTAHFRLVLEAGARFPAVQEVFARVVGAGVQMLAQAARAGQGRGTVPSDLPPETLGRTLIAVLLGVLALQQAGLDPGVPAVRDLLVGWVGQPPRTS
jgi:AcrR family transcriptional regulator